MKILVGPQPVAFDVHYQLLCTRSTYFAKVLPEELKNPDGTFKLPEDDPHLFGLVLHWLYKGSFDSQQLPPSVDGIRSSIRLHVLVDRLQLSSSASVLTSGDSFLSIIRRDMRESKAMLNCDEIDYIYKNSSESSPLRQFAVNLTAFACYKFGIPIETYRESLEKTPGFAVDFCKRTCSAFAPMVLIQDPRTLPAANLFGSISSGNNDQKYPASSLFGPPAQNIITTPLTSHTAFLNASAPTLSNGLPSAKPASAASSDTIFRPDTVTSAPLNSSASTHSNLFNNIFSKTDLQRPSLEVEDLDSVSSLHWLTSCRS